MKHHVLLAYGSKILVQPDDVGEQKLGSIVLPDSAKGMLREGRVVSFGKDCPEGLGVNDRVAFQVGDDHKTVTFQGIEYFILDEAHVAGVISELE